MATPEPPTRRPEGDLVAREMKRRHISYRQLAPEAGITEARLRQIVSGYASAGAGQRMTVIAPALTLARIAKALDIDGDQLTGAGRADAAAELADLQPESAVTGDALANLDDEAVKEVMRRADVSDTDKRQLVELLLSARRADDARRLDLARSLLDMWRRTQTG